MRSGSFSSAGIGLVMLQFFASAALAFVYVALDGAVTAYRLRRDELPLCEAEGERGCVVRRERQQRALSAV